MKFFKRFLKNFHSQKGITGTDVAIAIIIISVTIAVITGIYINVTNGSKENIRYSAVTRIATQIAEKIEAMSYDELASVTTWAIDNELTDRKILDITIPKGYEVVVTEVGVDSGLDIVKKYDIAVSYKVNKSYDDSINIQVVKERELLEQTNKPDLYLIDNYANDSYIYPIKYTATGYVITTVSDKAWYNYDNGEYAQVYISSVEKNIGDVVVPGNGEKYVWIPRFGKTATEQLDETNLTYLYGTSKHCIVFKNVDVTNKLYTYTINYEEGAYVDAEAYVANTFEDNDGLTGMWYLIGGTTENTTEETTAYNALTSILEKVN